MTSATTLRVTRHTRVQTSRRIPRLVVQTQGERKTQTYKVADFRDYHGDVLYPGDEGYPSDTSTVCVRLDGAVHRPASVIETAARMLYGGGIPGVFANQCTPDGFTSVWKCHGRTVIKTVRLEGFTKAELSEVRKLWARKVR